MSDDAMIVLEAKIESLPGVLGCVILTTSDGYPSEVQAFTRIGTNLGEVRQAVVQEINNSDLHGDPPRVYVFELEAESHFGDRESLARAAELAEQEARSRGPISTEAPPEPPLRVPREPRPGVKARPILKRVLLVSSPGADASEAEVTLERTEGEYVGKATGQKTTHGLKVLANAALHAAGRLVPEVDFRLAGASLVSALGRETVLVFVKDGDLEVVGAAIVRDGPISEATVRATLDAINRRLADEF